MPHLPETLAVTYFESLVKESNFPTGVIYFDADPFMPTVFKASKEKLEETNDKYSLSETYNDDYHDFKALLLKAKKKKLKSLVFLGYDKMGLAMKQARQLGIKSQFYAINTISSPGYNELGGKALENTIVPLWQAKRGEKFDRFLSDFKEIKQRKPFLEISTVPSYDIAEIIVSKLKTKNLNNDPLKMEDIKNHFYTLNNYEGLSGNITIDSDGITRSLKSYVKKYLGNGNFE